MCDKTRQEPEVKLEAGAQRVPEMAPGHHDHHRHYDQYHDHYVHHHDHFDQ